MKWKTIVQRATDQARKNVNSTQNDWTGTGYRELDSKKPNDLNRRYNELVPEDYLIVYEGGEYGDACTGYHEPFPMM